MAGLFGGIWLGFAIAGPIGSVALGLLGMVVGWVIGMLRWSGRQTRVNAALTRAKAEAEKRGETWEYDD